MYHGRGEKLCSIINFFSKSDSVSWTTNWLQGLSYLKDHERNYLYKILPHVVVFARCAPKQKEYIITTLQEIGYATLMCGDGTNDVGALKHASVGVAILSSPPKREGTKSGATTPVTPKSNSVEPTPPAANGPRLNPRQQQLNSAKSKIEKLMKDLEEQEQSVVVKLGDASIAAPFTSKFSSIQCSKFAAIYSSSVVNKLTLTDYLFWHLQFAM